METVTLQELKEKSKTINNSNEAYDLLFRYLQALENRLDLIQETQKQIDNRPKYVSEK